MDWMSKGLKPKRFHQWHLIIVLWRWLRELTRTAKDDVEVKTIDTDGWIVFDSQIDVFLNTETEVSVLREVFASQLVFSDLEKEEKLTFINRAIFFSWKSLRIWGNLCLNSCKQFSIKMSKPQLQKRTFLLHVLGSVDGNFKPSTDKAECAAEELHCSLTHLETFF